MLLNFLLVSQPQPQPQIKLEMLGLRFCRITFLSADVDKNAVLVQLAQYGDLIPGTDSWLIEGTRRRELQACLSGMGLEVQVS